MSLLEQFFLSHPKLMQFSLDLKSCRLAIYLVAAIGGFFIAFNVRQSEMPFKDGLKDIPFPLWTMKCWRLSFFFGLV